MVGQLHLARAFWGPVPSGAAVMAPSFALPAGTSAVDRRWPLPVPSSSPAVGW
ncbi:MAG: hypothetical protein ACLQVK_09705 [Acidimicrobiales bacterium]